MSRRPLRSKLAVAAASGLLFGAAAVWAYRALRADPAPVEVVDDPGVLRDVMQPGGEAPPADADAPGFLRARLSEQQAAAFFPAIAEGAHWRYDPAMFARRVANDSYWLPFEEHPDRGFRVLTNSLGMREFAEPRAEAPALRILFAGDSHLDGAHANAHSIPSRLREMLAVDRGEDAVETLNAGQGSHTLHNYAGTWETFRDLRPDVFVVVVYGGNDFSEAARLDRFVRGAGPHATRPHLFEYSRLTDSQASLLPQELSQEAYFLNNPEDVERAVDVARDYALWQIEACREVGARAVFVYLPPPTRAQPALYRDTLDACLAHARTDAERFGVSDRLADAWIAALAAEGVAVIDLRPTIAQHEEPLYWHLDHHLNPRGALVVAERLARWFAEDAARGE